MGMRAQRWSMGLTLGAACLLGWVWAEAAAPLIRVAQVVTRGTSVTAYLDLRDSDGGLLTGITAAQLGATLGAHPASVDELLPVAGTGEGIAYVFLVDVSRSLSDAQFTLLKRALGEWLAGLGPADRAALISFGKGVRLVADFTADRALLEAALNKLAPTDSQTFLHQGLLTALTLGQRRDAGLPERRAIITLTDGIDDVAGGVSAEEVYAQIREGRIPLYAIGFASGRDRARRDAGLNALGQFTRRSGGSFRDATGGDLADAYRTLHQHIAEQYRARLSCGDCLADGSLYRLQLLLHQGGATIATDLDVRLLAAHEVAKPPVVDATPAPEKPEAPAEPEALEKAGSPGSAERTDAARAPESVKTDTEATAAEAANPPASPSLHWVWVSAGGALLFLLLLLWWLARRRTAKAAAAEQAAAQAKASAETFPDLPAPNEPRRWLPTASRPSPPTGPTLTLVVVRGQHRGEHFSLILDGARILGRSVVCDLVLANDPEVSQRHCRLRIFEPHLLIEDLDSTNGTRVNGVPIEAAYALADGDVLGIGRTELRVLWTGKPG